MHIALLDTDLLNDVLKKPNQHVVKRAAVYLQQHRVFAISGVTWYEIVRGLREERASKQLQRFQQFCLHCLVFDVSRSVLDQAADL